MSAIDGILAALSGVRSSGPGKWSARCPAHDDRHQSLGVGAFPDGGVWLRCHAGCANANILAAMGMSNSDLRGESLIGPRPAVIHKPLPGLPTFEAAVAKALRQAVGSTHAATWYYTDAHGVEVVRVIRLNLPPQPDDPPNAKPRKTFRPVHRSTRGWLLLDPPGPFPLYRLLTLETPKRVYIVEGEKAVDAAASIGLVATTSLHGAQAPQKSDWSVLAGKELVVVPDEDEAGAKYAALVQACLEGLTPSPRVKLLRLPGLSDKDDIYDFIERRKGEGQQAEEIRQEVERLTEATPFIGAEAWPDPQSIPEVLRPVLPFSPELLPKALRGYVLDGSQRISCPVDYVAVSAVVGLACIVGRKVGIRPKRHDNWTVVANLWGGIVGRPGSMKTSAIKEGLYPLKARESAAKRSHAAELKDRKAAEMVKKVKQQKVSYEIREALEDSEEAALQKAAEALDDEDPLPVRKRFIVNDTTVEKLGEILNQNPDGVLVYRDELTGFLMSLEKAGQEGARAFYLEAWDGTSPYSFDRIGRGTLEIESTCVSILGGIQPGPLSQHLRAAARGGAGDDGLVQRFQLLIWPDLSAIWRNVDRPPDPEARAAVNRVYEALADADYLSFGAEHDPHDASGIAFLRFDEEAQAVFDRWREALELRLRAMNEPPIYESHLSKFRSLIPSLALLFHLAEGRRGPVGRDVLEMAISWGPYLESHAQRIYSYSMDAVHQAAQELSRKIHDGELEDGFTARSVYRRGWTSLADAEVVEETCEFLTDLGWLRACRKSTAGRSMVTYSINPKLACPDVARRLGFPETKDRQN